MQVILNKITKRILDRHNEKDNTVRVINIWNHDQESIIVPIMEFPIASKNRPIWENTILKFKKCDISGIQFTINYRNHYIYFTPEKNLITYVNPLKGTVFINSKKEFDEEVLEVILPLLQI